MKTSVLEILEIREDRTRMRKVAAKTLRRAGSEI